MNQRLLHEGKTDGHFVGNLLKAHSLVPKGYDKNRPLDFFANAEGVSKIKKEISTILKLSDLTNFGIIADADENPATSRWTSLRSNLINNGFEEKNLPKEPNPNGTIIIQEGKPKVGIWIMPDNINTGYLEHLYGKIIVEEDEMLIEATKIINRFVGKGNFRFKDTHRQKAIICSWLAWQEKVGEPMGRSIHTEFINENAPIALQFIEWMKNTFEFSEEK